MRTNGVDSQSGQRWPEVLWRYAVALAAVIIAVAGREALNPVVGGGVPFVTFYVAVAVVGIAAGTGAGIVTTLLSVLAGTWFFIEPRQSLAIANTADIIRVFAFLVAGTIVSLVGGRISRQLERVAAAEREARKLAGIIEATSDFVGINAAAGGIVYLNPAGRKLLGIPEGRDAQSLQYSDLWPEWFFKRTREQWVPAAVREGVVSGEGALRTQAGKEIPVSFVMLAQRNRKGELEYISTIARDISEQKQAQQVLARGKEELEKLVAERTAQLRELVGELEHFSYTITHDMRAPLRAMRAFAEALKEASEPRLGDEERMFVRRIITGAERMDALIADALSYSKAVRQELPLAPVDVGTLLQGMLDTYPEFQTSQAAIALDRKIPLVMGNEAGLTQCFSNLLGNAVKFVPPGAVARVRVWSESREGWVRLWVEDNGIGISEEMLARVFDMFSRGSHPGAGTGIGLALVRKVVDRMGGKVGVTSTPGKGSRFWVDLKAGQVKTTAEHPFSASAGVH